MPLQATNAPIPILAFIGVEGGVGKTTLALGFAKLIASMPTFPNVLLVDMDVHVLSNLTQKVIRHIPSECTSWHECVFHNKNKVSALIDIGSGQKITSASATGGKLCLLPAFSPTSQEVFQTDADSNPDTIEGILHSLLEEAYTKYNFSCVILNCGSTITPYMAAALNICDKAFLVGNDQTINHWTPLYWTKRLQNLSQDVSVEKITFIINKVDQEDIKNPYYPKDKDLIFVPYVPGFLNLILRPGETKGKGFRRSEILYRALSKLADIAFKDISPNLLPPKMPTSWQTSSRFDKLFAVPGLGVFISPLFYIAGIGMRADLGLFALEHFSRRFDDRE